MRKNDDPVVVEQSFNAAPEIVWKAKTEIDQMRQWYFDNIPDFKPEIGFEIQDIAEYGKLKFVESSKMAVIAPKDLAYGILRAFEVYREQENAKARVFCTKQEATEWLESQH